MLKSLRFSSQKIMTMIESLFELKYPVRRDYSFFHNSLGMHFAVNAVRNK
jgi:hypothetical protein